MVGLFSSLENNEINQLISRGHDLLQRIQVVKDSMFFASVLGYLGRMVTAHVNDESWKSTANELVGAGVNALTDAAKKLHEDYTEWYTDCRILFSKRGWNRSKTVKVFDEILNIVKLDSVAARVKMIVERQIGLLDELRQNPPRTWSLTKASILVVYASICVFVDTILSIMYGLAVVPVIVFEVGLILAFPKLEEWVVS